MGSLFLAYLAGVVTILSPCVLPLIPIIIGSSLTEHKRGPLFLVAGLIISFTTFGMIVSTIGFSIGLTTGTLQIIAASFMIAFGVILLVNPIYQRFAAIASSSTSGMNSRLATVAFSGGRGQFFLGILLGAVWSPCVGPTLGAAISLASQGQDLFYAASVMLIFAIGTSTPIIIMSLYSQQSMMKMKSKMMNASRWLKPLMGGVFIAIGVFIVTGFMVKIEEAMLQAMPESFVSFIYQF